MYYPYFRGRQNELLCLKELLQSNKLNKKITPVLEPVRFNTTFFSTLKLFIEREREIILIQNPSVGKFAEEYAKAIEDANNEPSEEKKDKLKKTLEEYRKLLEDKHVRKGYLVNHDSVENIRKMPIEKRKEVYLLNQNKGDDNYYSEYGEELIAEASFIPKDEDFKEIVKGNAIILEDGYQKAKRNADYIDEPDVSFSKNHLVYKKRGYQGFSDYSIVGNEYEESGFAPAAVAIHIVYFTTKNELRVHHFVSDSNKTIYDPAGKFEEAMQKLILWEMLEEKGMHTKGLMSLIDYYQQGRFPGLGVIKRFSLMHHLELMGSFLEDEE